MWTPSIAAEVRKLHTAPSNVDYVGKLYLYVGTVQRICLFSDGFYSDTAITTAVEWCTDISAGPHVCGVSLMVLMFVFTIAYGLCRAGGGVEYLHSSPESRRRRSKGNPVPGYITGSPCSCGI
jgi:hypothetical protein